MAPNWELHTNTFLAGTALTYDSKAINWQHSQNCDFPSLCPPVSGDFSSTAAVSTWLSMGELQEYKQVEGRKEKGKVRNRGGGQVTVRKNIFIVCTVQRRRGAM